MHMPFMLVCPSISTLFPYTTLFRSKFERLGQHGRDGDQPQGSHVRLFPDQGKGILEAPVRGWKGRVDEENARSEEHTSELQSQSNLVCRLLLEKKNRADRKSHIQFR